MTSVILAVDEQTRAHLARALSDHVRRCKVNGWPVPASIRQLEATFAASDGHGRPSDAVLAPPADSGPVALTYDEAAHLLAVSPRTVRRLVAADALPAISIGGSRRITREAVTEYLEGLTRSDRNAS